MKKTLLLTAALLALTCSLATAGGINFTWGMGCWPETPSSLELFACDVNTGNHLATASFVISANQPTFVGIEAVVDIQAASPGLPDWWQFFNPGSCRQTSLSVSSNFTAAPNIICVDPWMGLAAGGIAAYQTVTTVPAVPSGLPNAARLKLAEALADPPPGGIVVGPEYYGFSMTINNAKTVGSPLCVGCEIPVCLALNEIKAAPLVGNAERISTPMANQLLSWNGGTHCDTTPSQNKTWGQVKSLYR